MKYLANDRNIVRDASLSASNILASNVVYRTDDDAKKGGGHVDLMGDYTGASDATFDIKIADTTISGTPKISSPTFTGVGNGTLTSAAADSTIAAQEFVVTLEDLGTQTAKAYAPFQGVTLIARASGTAGNLISVAIDNSALTLTATDFALQDDLKSGTNEYTGDQWNFGAAIQNVDGTIPDTAPRISFGSDPQVYRQYKFYRNGTYVYSFSPSPVRDVSKGGQVYLVTGARVATVTNGTTTETFGSLVTLYDALSALRGSTLIDVQGAVVNDKTPGGQGATDLSVWTQAYVYGVLKSGGDAMADAVLTVTPAAAAPTETLTVTCKDGTIVGGEVWEVRGDVSGKLADAITAVLYADGPYTFRIPKPVVPATQGGQMLVEYIPNGTRETMPSLCVVKPLIGAAARAGTWEFVYTKRPGATCDCTTGELSGGPNFDCLGIDPPGGTAVSDESRLIRLQRLATDVRTFVGDNTPNTARLATLSDTVDIDWINRSAKILADCLESIASATPLVKWVASTAYTIDKQRVPTADNGYRYAVTTAGMSGSSEPTWPTTIGSTVSDGSVTWTCVGKTPFAMWDDLRTQWKMETAALDSYPPLAYPIAAWSASLAIANANEGVYIRPSTRNGHLYFTDDITTTGGSEPTWPLTPRGSVRDSTGTWTEFLNYWNASTAYALDAEATPGDGFLWVVTTAGTSGSSEPNWYTAGNTLTDGTVTWTRKNAGAIQTIPLSASSLDGFAQRYNSACNDILAAAGIDPNFPDASTDGDGCWHDFKDGDFWWVFNGTDAYLPIQTGHYYISSKLVTGPDGKPFAESTKEFGFGPKFGCPENLIEGDIIRITISGNAGQHGYQAGDNFVIRINHAEAVPFGGGQTGDDTLTFSVVGSVAGRLTDYALVTTALAAYSSAGGHLGFQITPGGIPFALGDQFRFTVEGGHFEWRKNGGSWSSATAIAASVSLSDGLSATFAGGTAPSWVPGDQWSFTAEATNGADGLRQPTDARAQWTGSTEIIVAPASPAAIDGVLLCDHDIPSDATITLLGSDDNFATTPLSVTLPWRERHIWVAFPAATRAKYKVTINKGGSANWLWLGQDLEMLMQNGAVEFGKLTKKRRMVSIAARSGLGGQIVHDAVTEDSIEALLAMLDQACANDDCRFAIVPHDGDVEIALVRYSADSLDITDVFNYQPSDPTRRLQSVTLALDAVA